MAFAEELAEGLTRGAITALIDRRDVLVPFAADLTRAVVATWLALRESTAVVAKPDPAYQADVEARRDAAVKAGELPA